MIVLNRFVVGKALRLGLKPIVVINKVDRPDQRAMEVHNEIFDLFAALEASDEQLDFPTIYASAKQGWACDTIDTRGEDLAPLFELIVRHVPAPSVEEGGAFRMLATTLENNPYLGRLLTGRIEGGTAKVNMPIRALSRDGKLIENARITIDRATVDVGHYRTRLELASNVEGMRKELERIQVGSRLHCLIATDGRVEMARNLAEAESTIRSAKSDLEVQLSEREVFIQKWNGDIIRELLDRRGEY